MSAPAAAFVDVAQFFSRWRTPCEYVATGQPVLPGSYTPGSSAAVAAAANASVQAAAAMAMSRFMSDPFRSLGYGGRLAEPEDRKRRVTKCLPSGVGVRVG